MKRMKEIQAQKESGVGEARRCSPPPFAGAVALLPPTIYSGGWVGAVSNFDTAKAEEF